MVHSGLLRENVFLSRGRALLTSKINYVSRARPTLLTPLSSCFFGQNNIFQRSLQKSKVQFIYYCVYTHLLPEGRDSVAAFFISAEDRRGIPAR